MKIKIFVVTYNDPETLNNKALKSIFNVDRAGHDVEINIINNHSNFSLNEEYRDVKILHNDTRPDFSRGHLSRNWNQAILNGFKDLKNPDCDILILSQDDVDWNPDAINMLIDVHKKYSFYSDNRGDSLMSYLPDAVKKIGLWDERFNGLGFHDAEYFLRVLIYNRNKSSINDIGHHRILNPVPNHIDNFYNRSNRDHNCKGYSHDYCHDLYHLKWPGMGFEWNENFFKRAKEVKHSSIQNFVLYPYFEKDIELENKNYYISPNGLNSWNIYWKP